MKIAFVASFLLAVVFTEVRLPAKRNERRGLKGKKGGKKGKGKATFSPDDFSWGM